MLLAVATVRPFKSIDQPQTVKIDHGQDLPLMLGFDPSTRGFQNCERTLPWCLRASH